MNNHEKAKIILEELDNYINVDWKFEDIYIKAIQEGLVKINNLEATKSNE